jgi:GT2 family glycosyltransferase/2-polyprenyl-3-methyl-5-hydroxy-6-metoxy-1,4-benzoquinol methylase
VTTVSAIIIGYNRQGDLRLAIDALLASELRPQVVVVDNASADGSADVAESYPGVVVVRNSENLGFAAAVDQGLERAEGRYIALVNNDAVVAPDWTARLVEFLERHPDAAAAAGKIHHWDEQHPLGSRENGYYAYTRVDPMTGYTHAVLDAPDGVREVATLSGAAVMVRRAAIDDIGGPFLEPSFFLYYEETDFFARAIRRGWKLYYTGAPAAWHRLRGSSTSWVYHHYMERNRLLYAFRNFSDRGARWAAAMTARQALRELTNVRNLWGLARGEDVPRARAAAWRWLVENRDLLRAQRRHTADDEVPFETVVQGIEARAAYYDHPRTAVADLVPETAAVVVDVGCGGGALGAYLKKTRPSLRVYGIEPVAEQAARASRWLDGVAAGVAEDGVPQGWPRPDCVIFADVLEHLPDPWSVLQRWHDELAPGGVVVVSVPNVAHVSVVAPILGGRWDYAEAGVLDRTHLRFFTLETALALVQKAGLEVGRVERVVDVYPDVMPPEWQQRLHRFAQGAPPLEGAGPLRRRLADLCTVQYLLVGRKAAAS